MLCSLYNRTSQQWMNAQWSCSQGHIQVLSKTLDSEGNIYFWNQILFQNFLWKGNWHFGQWRRRIILECYYKSCPRSSSCTMYRCRFLLFCLASCRLQLLLKDLGTTPANSKQRVRYVQEFRWCITRPQSMISSLIIAHLCLKLMPGFP